MSVLDAGLCETCRHQRVVRTTRGSRFSLCRRSESDPAYSRYPRVPVLECRGWERRAETPGAGETGPGNSGRSNG